MKKVRVLLIAVCFTMLVAGSASAKLNVGVQGVFLKEKDSGQSFPGAGVTIGMPIEAVPGLSVQGEASFVKATITGVDTTVVPLLISGRYKAPELPIYGGGSVGLALGSMSYTGLSGSATGINANLFGGAEYAFTPGTTAFAQVSYEIMKLSINVLGIPVGEADLTGVGFRGGVRFDI